MTITIEIPARTVVFTADEKRIAQLVRERDEYGLAEHHYAIWEQVEERVADPVYEEILTEIEKVIGVKAHIEPEATKE